MKNSIKNFLKSSFGFSRTETRGFFVMIILLTIALLSPMGIEHINVRSNGVSPEMQVKLDSLVALMERKLVISQAKLNESQYSTFKVPNNQKIDPNTADFRTFRALGFSSEIANRIVKFRKSGGKFFKIQDLEKIYGLDKEVLATLSKKLKFPNREKRVRRKPKKIVKKSVTIPKMDINVADSTQLKLVAGIGSTLSARIIKFRDKLGGFHNLNQLDEVYGLAPEVSAALKQNAFISRDFKPIKLNINKATNAEIRHHPYISYAIADAITKYRNQHGPFESLEQMLNIHILSEKQFRKIKPYVSF